MDRDHVHLKLSVKWFKCVGAWPMDFDKKLFRVAYKLYFALTLTLYVVFVATEFVEMYVVIQERSLEEFSSIMGIIILHALGLAKFWVVVGPTVQKLTRKILVTERNILEGEDDAARRIYFEHVGKNRKVNSIMASLAIVCYFLYCSAPMVTELINSDLEFRQISEDNVTIVYKARPLPLRSWFPFDPYKYYKTSFACHVLALTVIPTYIVACNNFFFGLAIFAVSQTKILQHNLVRFGKGGLEGGDREGETDEVDLRKCVEHHTAIIAFVEDLSRAMKNFLLLDFAACTLQMAVIGFQAAVMDFSFQLVKTLIYLATLLSQLFFYYWYANEVLLESTNVALSVWGSEWYGSSKNTKKILHLIMMRAQKPLTLSVGPFYYMSTQTMLAIVRVGYSYAAVMRRIHSN